MQNSWRLAGNNDLRELIFKYSLFWPLKVKHDPEFVADSNASRSLITFQLANLRELETIKYVIGSPRPIYFLTMDSS